jgi:bifunctional DNA-binding transcriptional regulator/antitoxin component of YhaV-PrlF toxin-antitoxin module
MQAVMEQRIMVKKRIAVSGKRQITIPIEFFSQLGIEKEVECYVRNGSLIIRPAVPETSGEFAEQILADLIAQGFQGDALFQRFKQTNRAVRPAVEKMLAEADDIASEKTTGATLADVFGSEDD